MCFHTDLRRHKLLAHPKSTVWSWQVFEDLCDTQEGTSAQGLLLTSASEQALEDVEGLAGARRALLWKRAKSTGSEFRVKHINFSVFLDLIHVPVKSQQKRPDKQARIRGEAGNE